MKHIKQYESVKEKLQKYVIWYSDFTDKYEILQILSKSKEVDENNIDRHTLYTCKTLYYYNKFNNQLLSTNSKSNETFFNTAIKNFVKYTTNNLKQCKEMVRILYNTDKYNL